MSASSKTSPTSHFASDNRVKRENKLSKVVVTVVTLRVDTVLKRLFPREGLEVASFVWKCFRIHNMERTGKPDYLQ